MIESYTKIANIILNELSLQTIRTAGIEARRRQGEAEKALARNRRIGRSRVYGGDNPEADDAWKRRTQMQRDTKRRQADKFERRVFIQQGGTARADAMPKYSSAEERDRMDKAADQRYPRKDSEGTPIRTGYSRESFNSPEEAARLKKRYNLSPEQKKAVNLRGKRLRAGANRVTQNSGLSEGRKGVMPKMKMGVHKSHAGGLTQKGVEAYRRANPGSKLKTAVTTKPSKLKKGSKSAKRRKSFCARMKGLKKRLTSAKTARDPDSRVNKSLRKWHC